MELGENPKPPTANPATIPNNGAPERMLTEAEARSERRLEIAISLLQGHLVLRERDGYDPGGFKKAEAERTCGGALDMAEKLMKLNEQFDQPEPEENLDGDIEDKPF